MGAALGGRCASAYRFEMQEASVPNYYSTKRRQRPLIRPGERGSQAISVSLAVIVLLLAGLWEAAAFAQAYPAKPIKLIVPFPAGGPADLTTRVVAQSRYRGNR